MTELARKTCTPCRGGVPPLSAPEAQGYLPGAPGWTLAEEATRLEKTYRFANFRETLDFVREVGELAEREFHHPLLVTFAWGFCTLVLQTKKIKGLHENDFIMAAKIDALAADR